MNIKYLNTEHKSTEDFIHKCPECKRMMLFRQLCYERKMGIISELNAKNKRLLDEANRVFASMGYVDRF